MHNYINTQTLSNGGCRKDPVRRTGTNIARLGVFEVRGVQYIGERLGIKHGCGITIRRTGN